MPRYTQSTKDLLDSMMSDAKLNPVRQRPRVVHRERQARERLLVGEDRHVIAARRRLHGAHMVRVVVCHHDAHELGPADLPIGALSAERAAAPAARAAAEAEKAAALQAAKAEREEAEAALQSQAQRAAEAAQAQLAAAKRATEEEKATVGRLQAEIEASADVKALFSKYGRQLKKEWKSINGGVGPMKVEGKED